MAFEDETLLGPHRASVRRLDSPLHSLSSRTPPERNERERNHRVPHSPGGQETCRRFYAEPSLQRAAVSSTSKCYDRKLDFIDGVVRVKRPPKIPVVFTREEARAVLDRLVGEVSPDERPALRKRAALDGMRRLRVKDIDFGYGHITVWDGKGLRDRVTLLPERLRRPLQLHLERVQGASSPRCREGRRSRLPCRLLCEPKYPNAARSWAWQYVFPAAKVSTDPRSDETRRHHIGEKNLQNA